jgi:hypothetical protein
MAVPLSAAHPDPAADDGWAICCSGGGIRTAVYCLGALQRLEAERFFYQAKLIIGASGGGHMAASRALVARGLEQDGLAADAGTIPPYAPGSPEEQHLRDSSTVAPGAKTAPAGLLALLFDVAVTLLLFLAPLFAVAHAWGWVLRSQAILTPAGTGRSSQWAVSVTTPTWWIWPVIAAGVTLVIFLWWRGTLVPPGPGGQQRHGREAVESLRWAACITLILAVAMLAIPELVGWLSGPHSGALKTVLDNLGYGSGAAWTPAALAGLVVAVVAISQSAQKYLARYSLPSISADTRTSGRRTLTGYLLTLLLPWLASVLIVLAGFVAALRWVRDGAAAGFTSGQVLAVIVALAVVLVARILADLNWISLQDFSRWRLATAYAVVRDTTKPFATKARPGVLLSELGQQQPRLVLCATANINAQREVPPGRGGLSFTFDPDFATLHGPVPAETVQARTADYEALVGRNRFTLFDVSAIRGAPFPPTMSSATRSALRILFTVTDLRPGLWLPHPALVAAAAQEMNRQGEQSGPGIRWWHALGLMLWYSPPHPFWRLRKEKLGWKEARLWAYVLKLRKDPRRHTQRFGGLLYHALQPTLGMLYAEAVGHTSYRGTWMCVTDGGQYDNLGLVEALKHGTTLGVRHILVLDASGDQANTWSRLGKAIALARSDAGVSIDLDPTTMIRGGRDLVPGQVVRPWAHGRFSSPQSASSQSGDIWVCKLGWWTGAPWDVVAYAKQHPSYPSGNSSDLLQLYDAAEFDAYRELGWAAADDAAKHWTAAPEPPSAAGSETVRITSSPAIADTSIG